MSKAFLPAAALLLVSVSAMSDEVKIDGKWLGAIPRPNHNYPSVFIFKVKGDKLTGTVKPEDADEEFEIVDGKVKGNTISFKLGSTPGVYTGTVVGDEIKCKFEMKGGEFGNRTLPFTLNRATE